jgi:diguanylate cyclase (GGDEF)-like protein
MVQRMFNRQGLDVGQIARAQFIDSIADGMVALDTQDRIIDINVVAQKLLAPLTRELIGQPVTRALARWSDVMTNQGAVLGLPDPDAIMQRGAARRFVHIRIAPIQGDDGRPVGRLVILHDVTESQEHLAEIHTLQERLREESIHDELTGLYNRRYLSGLLSRTIAQARRELQPVSLLLLDIDHFKEINEAHGQDAGDLVLRQMADFLRRNIRLSDAVCRYGGDEFIAVLPNTPASGAVILAERWRTGISAHTIDLSGVPHRFTISLGLVTFPTNADDIDEILIVANETLSNAKSAGRNRIVVAPPIEPKPAHLTGK